MFIFLKKYTQQPQTSLDRKMKARLTRLWLCGTIWSSIRPWRYIGADPFWLRTQAAKGGILDEL